MSWDEDENTAERDLLREILITLRAILEVLDPRGEK